MFDLCPLLSSCTMDNIFEIDSLEIFNNVFEDVLLNLYNSKQPVITDLEPHKKQAAKDDIQKLIENSNFDINTIHNQLQSRGFKEDKVTSLVSIIKEKKTEIMYASILNHISKYGQTIQNFHWTIKIVKGISDMKTLSYPLLQLTILSQNPKGEQKQRVFDVNKDMLKTLICLLENKDNLL